MQHNDAFGLWCELVECQKSRRFRNSALLGFDSNTSSCSFAPLLPAVPLKCFIQNPIEMCICSTYSFRRYLYLLKGSSPNSVGISRSKACLGMNRSKGHEGHPLDCVAYISSRNAHPLWYPLYTHTQPERFTSRVQTVPRFVGKTYFSVRTHIGSTLSSTSYPCCVADDKVKG